MRLNPRLFIGAVVLGLMLSAALWFVVVPEYILKHADYGGSNNVRYLKTLALFDETYPGYGRDADHAGFRCGTCHEFPVFNLRTRKMLELRERPLIAMDTTLENYMALSPRGILEKICYLSSVCRRYGGTLTLLLHNTSLMSERQKQLYLKMLEMITK